MASCEIRQSEYIGMHTDADRVLAGGAFTLER